MTNKAALANRNGATQSLQRSGTIWLAGAGLNAIAFASNTTLAILKPSIFLAFLAGLNAGMAIYAAMAYRSNHRYLVLWQTLDNAVAECQREIDAGNRDRAEEIHEAIARDVERLKRL